jgi:nitrite reductase/ring-hydroxylating ferredoxin subunit
MLSKEHNELLTRTDRGTPMGGLLRSYWMPALLSEEIPAPDCPPVRVAMLGEQLVAFRDSQGRVGLVGEHCLHRGTSLFFGRNEECGLRCVYHGWKFDVDGNVVDTPAEPAGSDFKSKLKHTAYPTMEAAGIIFAYLGAPEKQPLFPNYEWAQTPKDQTYVTKALMDCNYLQGVEGECDSSHLSFLHREFSAEGRRQLFAVDTAPAYEVEESNFGVRLVATRKVGPETQYVRVSSFVMPTYCWVQARNREVHIYVPANDRNSWRYDLGFLKDRKPNADDWNRRTQIGPGHIKLRNLQNNYLQDREMQRTVNYTGIENFINHDACATESMGRIYDRSQEHLGVSDKAVIAVRKYLIDAVHGFQAGKEPPHIVRDAAQNHFTNIDTFGQTIPAGVSWREQFTHLR